MKVTLLSLLTMSIALGVQAQNNVNLVNYVGTVTGVTNSSVIINQNIYNNSTQSYFQNYVNGDQINILDDTNKLPWVINGVSGYWTYCPGSNTPVFIESACGCFIVFPCSAPDTCQPAQATCPESPDQSTIPQPIPTPAPTQDNSQNNTVITTGLPSPAPEPSTGAAPKEIVAVYGLVAGIAVAMFL